MSTSLKVIVWITGLIWVVFLAITILAACLKIQGLWDTAGPVFIVACIATYSVFKRSKGE